MMGLFTSLFRQKLIDSGLLEDAVDIHCHVLPGVDDGVKSMDLAIETLNVYKESGFSHLVCTPHIMSDYPKNSSSYLKEQFQAFEAVAKGVGVSVQLASEYMLDSNFLSHLESGPLLSYDNEHILIENSYFAPSPRMADQIYMLRSSGYTPILAHPERYIFLEKTDYKRLKEGNMLFQLNLLSLIGAYGSNAKKKAEFLLEKGYYDFVGTDTHRHRWLRRGLTFAVKKSTIKALKPLWNNNKELIRPK